MFSRSLSLNLAAALCLMAPLASAQKELPKPLPAPKSQDEKMKWFRDAKFGLFIHWGLYAIPAGEWKGKPIVGLGEWIMNRAQIPVAEYEQLARQFNPVKFNADEWVQMAEDAGMKYVVITSKHHDGFAMFHSQVEPVQHLRRHAVPSRPAQGTGGGVRTARHEIRRSTTRSAQDWHEPNGAGNTWDFGPEEKHDLRSSTCAARPSRRSRNCSPITAPSASSGSIRRAP